MIKYLTFFLLLVFLKNQNIVAQDGNGIEIQFVEQYSIVKQESVTFGTVVGPNRIEIDASGNIYICDRNSILKLDAQGNIIGNISPYGRGPGELQIVDACTLDDKHIVVYDGEKREILFFDKENLGFTFSGTYGKTRLPRDIAYMNGRYVVFNRGQFALETPSISIIDINKEEFEIIDAANAPKYAYLSGNMNGDGLTIDETGNVYYAYLPYPNIWKYNAAEGSLEELTIITDLYVGLSERKVNKLPKDHIEWIDYNFTISRVMGLYYLEENMLIRHIEYGNLFAGEKPQIWLDFVDINTNRLIDSKRIKKRILFTHKNFIYLEKDWDNVFEAYDAAKEGEHVPLFDVYEVRRN